MANVWKDGRQVAGNRIDSINPDKTFSQRLKELVAQLPPEAKPKVQLFNDLADEVEKMEVNFGKALRHAEKLEKEIEETASGDQNMITAMQAKLDQQDTNRRLVIRTALFMFAGQHGVDIEPQDVDDLVRFL